jgi:hypothetical protein
MGGKWNKKKKRIDNTFMTEERCKSAILLIIVAVGGEGICTSKWSGGGGSLLLSRTYKLFFLSCSSFAATWMARY